MWVIARLGRGTTIIVADWPSTFGVVASMSSCWTASREKVAQALFLFRGGGGAGFRHLFSPTWIKLGQNLHNKVGVLLSSTCRTHLRADKQRKKRGKEDHAPLPLPPSPPPPPWRLPCVWALQTECDHPCTWRSRRERYLRWVIFVTYILKCHIQDQHDNYITSSCYKYTIYRPIRYHPRDKIKH